LRSSPQQQVEVQGGYYAIQPINPQVVYLPQYDPTVVYVGGGLSPALLTFGIGIGITALLVSQPWGWGGWGWNWEARRVYYNRAPWGGWGGGYHPLGRGTGRGRCRITIGQVMAGTGAIGLRIIGLRTLRGIRRIASRVRVRARGGRSIRGHLRIIGLAMGVLRMAADLRLNRCDQERLEISRSHGLPILGRLLGFDRHRITGLRMRTVPLHRSQRRRRGLRRPDLLRRISRRRGRRVSRRGAGTGEDRGKVCPPLLVRSEIHVLAGIFHLAGGASGGGYVTVSGVIHDHAVGAEAPAQGADGALHSCDPASR
jgi:hypothetical protein